MHERPRPRDRTARARAFLQLTKPGITLFIGASAAGGFLTAAGGFGEPAAAMLMLLATMLTSAGAATLNHVAERASDALMQRTARRPLPSGIITTAEGRLFGWSLTATGLLLALATLPLTSALFLALSHVSYVYVYTPLKRRTPLCTLAGALPGALPVLAGAAATGRPLTVASIALAGVLFAWQIPHFLAIAWIARDDYARAGCPMLGVVDPSGRSSGSASLLYAIVMLVYAITIALAMPLHGLFPVVAATAGTAYVVLAWRFMRAPARAAALRLFFASLLVLPLLLLALALDVTLL